MKAAWAIPFFILGVISLGLSFNEANAELSPNNAYILEGAGFAVTEESIKNSEIDFALSTEQQVGSKANIIIEDGFVTLDEEDFLAVDLTGTALREGRYVRISGIAENSIGDEVSIRIFGRLIQNSDEGSVYGFTGRITQNEISHKIIYTTKLTGLTNLSTQTSTSPDTSNGVVIHIQKGAFDRSFTYIDIAQPTRLSFYSQDRIIIEPGTTITWINDDDVSHSITSGAGLSSSARTDLNDVKICEGVEELSEGSSYASGNCDFTTDGRISSGEILPGESWSVTVDERGFYRLADVDYIWMTSTIYAFPSTGSTIIGTPGEAFN